MIPDCDLLRQYAEHGDEAAFAEVVRRYVDLVYSAAWRQVGGDTGLAQDVAQGVFTELARQARPLSRRASLAGWLYTTARFTANNTRRHEHRRRVREQEAYAMNQTAHAREPNWDALQPVLDEAVCALNAADREAVLLRFFQNKNHGEVGSALGVSEDAARKRVDRALEKLRAHFARRGVTVSSAMLATAITANSVKAAPAGLAANVAGVSLAGAGIAAESIFLKILLMSTQAKILVVTAVMLVVAAPLIISLQKTNETSDTANQKTASAPKLTPSNVELPNRPATVVAVGGNSSAGKISPLPVQAQIAPALETKPTDPPVVGMMLEQLDKFVNSPPSDNRDLQIRLLVKALALNDPGLAFSKVGLIDDPKARNDATGLIYGAWLATQTQQGLAALAQLPDGKQTQAYYLNAFQTWAGANPAFPPLAATAALGLPPGPNQVQALDGVATGWANYDPQALLTWASGLQPANPAALYSAVVEASGQDPNLAAQYLNQLTDASAQSQAIQNISVNMTKTDPTATLAWLDQVATGATYDQSVAKLISTVVAKNPALASALMAQVTEPGVSDAVSASVASSNWARTFPHGAAAWLQTLPESPARDAAIQKLVTSTPRNYPH